MWLEPDAELAERRRAHYHCWAEQLKVITLVLPCDVCDPDRAYGEAEIDLQQPRDQDKWSRNVIPAVYLTHAPDTEKGYWAGMHELGHLATGRTKNCRRWKRWSIRRQETEAWLWALAHALVPPSPEQWRDIVFSLESYQRYGTPCRTTKSDPTFDRLLLEATKGGAE